MKKLFALFFSLVLSLSFFTGCSEEQTYSFYVPDGAPLLSVAGIVNDGADFGKDKIKGEVVTGADMAAKLLAKTPDFALAPINVCATAHNKTDGEYVFCGVALWGLNFIVSKDPGKTSISDFEGETVYAFQETGTPGATLKALIKMYYGYEPNILTDTNTAVKEDTVNVKFLQDPSKVRDALLGNIAEITDAKHGVLSEPVVTAVSGMKDKDENKIINSVVDMQACWAEKAGASYPQVGLLARKTLVENRKDDVEKFIELVKEQSEYVRENAEAVSKLAVETLQSSGLPNNPKVSENFIKSDRGQAVFAFGKSADVKSAVSAYLSKLADIQGMSIVGGKLPGEEFYL